jgi:cyclase
MRIIARLDIKNKNLIKGINLEGLKIVGEPNKFAIEYYENGIDELIFMDSVASLYGRNNLYDIINEASNNIFIPLTVGGGIRNIDDALKAFNSGADKITVNTAAVEDNNLINNLSKKFGSQSLVLSIEAKKIDKNKWEVFTNNGRQETGLNVIDWCKNAEDRGIGEILLTSVDMEGTKRGFDFELLNEVSANVKVPIIASGGFGKPEHMIKAFKDCSVDAVAIADAFHYKRYLVQDLKKIAKNENLKVRSL